MTKGPLTKYGIAFQDPCLRSKGYNFKMEAGFASDSNRMFYGTNEAISPQAEVYFTHVIRFFTLLRISLIAIL
jgi:hypothetical protein